MTADPVLRSLQLYRLVSGSDLFSKHATAPVPSQVQARADAVRSLDRTTNESRSDNNRRSAVGSRRPRSSSRGSRGSRRSRSSSRDSHPHSRGSHSHSSSHSRSPDAPADFRHSDSRNSSLWRSSPHINDARSMLPPPNPPPRQGTASHQFGSGSASVAPNPSSSHLGSLRPAVFSQNSPSSQHKRRSHHQSQVYKYLTSLPSSSLTIFRPRI